MKSFFGSKDGWAESLLIRIPPVRVAKERGVLRVTLDKKK